ncbi:transposase [Streptomyces sp. NPDC006984]|uniref:transposase n=1 Tax=Streptomyces sp. NPDC006984 TaxID=3155463 RepID=UPI0033C07A4B
MEDVRTRLAWRAVAAVRPQAWVVDGTGFPKDGVFSPGVARQYSGTLGKVGNCQIGVSIHAASDTASCPLSWRLFLPTAWDEPEPEAEARRRACRIPETEHHRPKWQLALDMLDDLAATGLRPAVLVADADFRHGLEETRPCLGAPGQGRDDRARPGRGAAAARLRRSRPPSGLVPRPGG